MFTEFTRIKITGYVAISMQLLNILRKLAQWVKYIYNETNTKDTGVSLTIYYMFLPARRYASAVLAVVVCLYVCLSAASRYCIKTVTDSITQMTPHYSSGTLVFWYQKSFQQNSCLLYTSDAADE